PILQLHRDRRLKALNVRAILRRESLCAPQADLLNALQVSVVRLLWRGMEQPVVSVAHHDGPPQLLQSRDALTWLRAGRRDIAQTQQTLDPARSDRAEDRVERDEIAMDIRDDGERHSVPL